MLWKKQGGAGQDEKIAYHLYLNADVCLKRFFDKYGIFFEYADNPLLFQASCCIIVIIKSSMKKYCCRMNIRLMCCT